MKTTITAPAHFDSANRELFEALADATSTDSPTEQQLDRLAAARAVPAAAPHQRRRPFVGRRPR